MTDTETLYVTTATLSKDYSEYSASLLNLIKISEDSISKMRNDPEPDASAPK